MGALRSITLRHNTIETLGSDAFTSAMPVEMRDALSFALGQATTYGSFASLPMDDALRTAVAKAAHTLGEQDLAKTLANYA